MHEDDDTNMDETPLLYAHHIETEDSDQSIEGPLNVDDIIEGLKVGPFHYLILLVCGLCFCGYTLIYSSMGFILVTACDLNITPSSKGWLNLSLMMGVSCSCPIFGKLSDTYGRWKIMTISMTIYLISMIVAAFSYNYIMFLVMLFVVGIGIGGNSATSSSYNIEFFPRAYRGMAAGSRLGLSIAANAYVCLIALLVLPHQFNIYIGVVKFSSWRIFLLLCSLPTLLAYFALLFMPEPIRFVIVKGNIKSISQTFNKIRQINSCCGSYDNSYQETLSLLQNKLDQIKKCSKGDQGASNVSQHKEKLYHKPWIIRFLLLCIAWIGVGFSIEGFTIWLPTLLNFYNNGNKCREQARHNLSWPVMQSALNYSNGSLCTGNREITHVITNILYGGILAIPFAIFCLFAVNRLGRKWLFCMIIFVIGICQFVMWLIDNTLAASIIGTIFSTLSSSVWISLTTWTVELFPTTLRSTTLGIVNVFLSCAGGIGMVIIGIIFEHNCTVTLLLFTTFSIFAGLASLYLPDTTNLDIN